MQIEIELDIYHHNEQTSTLKDIGVDYSLEDCETRKVTFYSIEAISPYIEGKKEFSCVHSNNSEFICVLKYKELKMLISNAPRKH